MNALIVQSDLAWEDPVANRNMYSDMLKELPGTRPDLVVLPEMFTTGFTMNSGDLAETMNGDTVSWMRDMSAKQGFAICGSIIVKDDGRFYNRLLFVDTDGNITSYDKAHLFRMEKESNFFARGLEQVITHFKGFRINLQICYDLRFPVWSRNVNNNFDVLIYVASWPASRRNVWNTLLVARAIENQCYVIGVNRLGTDGNGISYSGDSVIIDPKGNVLAEFDQGEAGMASAKLSKEELISFREKFPVWKDADRFTILD